MPSLQEIYVMIYAADKPPIDNSVGELWLERLRELNYRVSIDMNIERRVEYDVLQIDLVGISG